MSNGDQGVDVTAGPWPLYLRSGQSNNNVFPLNICFDHKYSLKFWFGEKLLHKDVPNIGGNLNLN
jgi:hypothetical protein